MIFKLILTITILYQVIEIRTNRLYSIPEVKDNFFHKVNTNLHNAITKIFNCFRIMRYFSKAEHNEILLLTHNDLMNVTEMNFKTYFYVKNVSVTNYSTGVYPNIYIDTINGILRELLRKNQSLNPMKYFRVTNETKASIFNETDISKDDNDSTEFLGDFLKTFEKITIENITNIARNDESTTVYKENVRTTESVGVKVILKSKKLELKVWNSSAVEPLLSNNTRRLYQGKPTKIKKYPFLVSVHIMNNFMCSGSIISKDLVVTAASCLQVAYSHHDNPRSVFVRVGSDYTKTFGQLIPVTEIHFHPDYDPRTLRNNLAVIRIMNNLKLSNEKGRIRRIEYDREKKTQTEGIYVLGWGAQEPKHNPSNFQKLAIDYLKIYTYAQCKEIYSDVYVAESNFCAGFTDKGSGACNKDVGGPGFRNGVLVGIISYGPPNCGMPNSPTVFTQLGYYADWLEGLVQQKKVVRQAKPVEKSIIRKRKQDIMAETLNPNILRIKPDFSEVNPNVLNHDPDYTEAMNPVMMNQDPDYAETMNPNILRQDYPEETIILNEMLKEFLTANTSVLNDMHDQHKKPYNHNNKVNFDVHSYNGQNNEPHKPKDDKHHDHKPDKANKNKSLEESTDSCGDISTSAKANGIKSDDSHDTSNCNSGENVSDNYEEKYDEIAIDASDPAFRNASFLDVVFNIEQYQKPHTVNNRTGEIYGTKDFVDIQFIIGTTNIPPLTKKHHNKNIILRSTRLNSEKITKQPKPFRTPEVQERKLYYDDIEVGREQKDDFSLNFESDKEPIVSDIKGMIGTIPKVKEIYYRRNNPFSYKKALV